MDADLFHVTHKQCLFNYETRLPHISLNTNVFQNKASVVLLSVTSQLFVHFEALCSAAEIQFLVCFYVTETAFFPAHQGMVPRTRIRILQA